MLDFLVAVGQFLCFIGLLYGLILTLANWKYAGSTECRYDPIIGHDWGREAPDETLQLIIVPEQFVTTVNQRQSEMKPPPFSRPAPEQSLVGLRESSR